LPSSPLPKSISFTAFGAFGEVNSLSFFLSIQPPEKGKSERNKKVICEQQGIEQPRGKSPPNFDAALLVAGFPAKKRAEPAFPLAPAAASFPPAKRKQKKRPERTAELEKLVSNLMERSELSHSKIREFKN
jgi:hypothetical protein